MVRYPSAIAVVVGVALGVALSQAGPAEATRNSAGTYSLPGGNPVVSGTTISSAWANNTLADVATELTNSLDRQGRGGMLAPLKLANGSAFLPALSWTSDPDTGFYRAGPGDIRMVVDGSTATMQQWTPLGTTLYGNLDVEGTSGFQQPVSFIDTVTFASPATFNARPTFSQSLVAMGITPNGPGIEGYGVGFGRGGYFEGGGASGEGIRTIGGAPSGNGLFAQGRGVGVGAQLVAGTAATAGTPRTAVLVSDGYVALSAVDPNSGVALANTLTPKNIVKAWARLLISSAGGVTLTDGFNVASVSVSTTTATLTFASAFANGNYVVFVTSGGGAPWAYYTNVVNSNTVQIKARNLAAGVVPLPELDFSAASGADRTFHVVALGSQ